MRAAARRHGPLAAGRSQRLQQGSPGECAWCWNTCAHAGNEEPPGRSAAAVGAGPGGAEDVCVCVCACVPSFSPDCMPSEAVELFVLLSSLNGPGCARQPWVCCAIGCKHNAPGQGLLCWAVGLLCWAVSLLCWAVGLLCWAVGLLFWATSLLCWDVGLLCWGVSLLLRAASLLCWDVGLLSWAAGLLFWAVSWL